MPSLLELEGVTAGYGDAVVLEDIDLRLEEGGSLAVLGRNGVGKSTLVTTLMGLTRLHRGRLLWRGADIARVPAYRRAQAGLGWVPQERLMWPSLTVEEHLTAVARPGPWTVPRLWALFPALAGRRANRGGQLSGGEQQMLAIARALAMNPALLLLDEPMEGLAPRIVQDLVAAIHGVLAEGRLAALIVEQHARLALSLTENAVVLDRGRIVHRSPSAALLADEALLHRMLSVA